MYGFSLCVRGMSVRPQEDCVSGGDVVVVVMVLVVVMVVVVVVAVVLVVIYLFI